MDYAKKLNSLHGSQKLDYKLTHDVRGVKVGGSEYVYYKTKNNTVASYRITNAVEYNSIQEEKAKKRRLMRYLDEKAEKEWDLEHSQGYCEKCGCLKALNGTCPICD